MKLFSLLCYLVVLQVGPGITARRIKASSECPGRCTGLLNPVYGTDGVIYSNPCLAACQGVMYAAESSGGTPFGWPLEVFQVDTVVTLRTIQRFKDEGFSYIARINLYEISMEPPSLPQDSSSVKPRPQDQWAVRVTSEGDVYVRAAPVDLNPKIPADVDDPTSNGTATSPPIPPSTRISLDSASSLQPAIVLGTDDRIKVTSTAFPFSAIGRIVVEKEDGSSALCTGSRISERVVLSAAHCVYDREKKQFVKSLTFAPTQQGDLQPLGIATSTFFTVYTAYIEQGGFGWDMAVIQLDDPSTLTGVTGFFPVASNCNLTDVILNTAGYPADKPGRNTMWFNSCTVSDGECERDPNSILEHKCDTFGGQSGSPMWRFNPTTNTRTIVAVHVGAIGIGSPDATNVGKQLTPTDLAAIAAWSL